MAAVQINDELHRKFKVACSKRGLNMKDIANSKIRDWLIEIGEIKK